MTPTHRHNQSGLNHFGRDGLKPPQIADRNSHEHNSSNTTQRRAVATSEGFESQKVNDS
ncbi:hypothetical protein RBSWK_02403 [Rhodopirellula baltica SWK14]|uniref:Uncharacterized protein n=1 Tax=Rhodopirellula baltica SWK14 TaxID=993516 RepID=L7CIJ8_RHOBT|nr:hypothetical protein RBSWK_02403 [Rhodopirellula baltica SWK14]